MAETPTVVADIAPVHSLVSRVMQGVGTPDLLLPPGVSPHGYSMRPSEARSLQNADIVIWMGEDLTPWLEDAVATLAGEEKSFELLHVEGTHLLDYREGAVFAEHDDHDDHHDEGHDAHDDHDDHKDHDDHDDHGDKHDDHHDDHKDHHDEHDDHKDDHADEHHDDHHDDHDDHDEHKGEEDAHGHNHAHGAHDPHAWLAPENAKFWLNVIAEKLSEIDPTNAELYATNAAAAASEIDDVTEELKAKLAPFADHRFVVFHDAYQYFEESFGLNATGALQLSDATPPSAARLAEIQEEIVEHNIACVFAEPQFDPSLVAAVAGDIAKSAELDPLGAELPTGPSQYLALLKHLAHEVETCLK